jgi:hypothetical protein
MPMRDHGKRRGRRLDSGISFSKSCGWGSLGKSLRWRNFALPRQVDHTESHSHGSRQTPFHNFHKEIRGRDPGQRKSKFFTAKNMEVLAFATDQMVKKLSKFFLSSSFTAVIKIGPDWFVSTNNRSSALSKSGELPSMPIIRRISSARECCDDLRCYSPFSCSLGKV